MQVLESKATDRNRERPKHVRDFDLNAGLHNLRDVSDTPRHRVWATPLWRNILFLALLGVALWAAAYIYSFPVEGLNHPESPWTAVLRGVGVATFVVVAGFCGVQVIHRGRLVLDRDERTLCFSYILLCPRAGQRRVSLDEIVSLNLRSVTEAGDDETTGWTHRIVVAELRDGRLASIAFDSTPGIVDAIREAAGPEGG